MKNRIVKLLWISCLITIPATAFAQTPTLEWAFNIGSSNNEAATELVTDSAGNIYLIGACAGTIDFDPSNSTNYFTPVGIRIAFISKYDSSGAFQWVVPLDGSGVISYIYSAAFDNLGNLIVAGEYNNDIDFDPSLGTALLSGTSHSDGFIAKYSPNGGYIWANRIGGGGYDAVRDFTVDSQSNIIAVIDFTNTIDVDPSSVVYDLISAGSHDICFVKYSSSGNFIWAKQIKGTNDEYFAYITQDNQGNLYITGQFQSTDADFDPSTSTALLATSGFQDVFIAKYDAIGSFQWAYRIGGSSFENAFGITCDQFGAIYLFGTFMQTADLDPSPTSTYNFTSIGVTDIFFLKLNNLGGLIFAKGIGGAGAEMPFVLEFDTSYNIYISGYFSQSLDFDLSMGMALLISNGSTDNFIAKYDSAFIYQWAFQIGGTGSEQDSRFRFDNNGNLICSGLMDATVDVDPSVNNYILTSHGSNDPFLCKYILCPSSSSTITASVCYPYTLNGQTYNQSGTYTQTLTNYLGCDSIISLNLTITIIDDSVSRNGMTLTAMQSGAAYQWINCDNNNLPVAGAINQSYTAPDHGRFAVIITMNGCVDTSDCINNYYVGMTEFQDSWTITVYPNPCGGEFIVQVSPGASSHLWISVHDIVGRLIWDDQIIMDGQTLIKPGIKLPCGEYLVTVSDGEHKKTCRLVVAE